MMSLPGNVLAPQKCSSQECKLHSSTKYEQVFDSLSVPPSNLLLQSVTGIYVRNIAFNYCFVNAEFEKAVIDLDKPLVVSCGGAIVAGLVAFTAHLLGKEVPVYDVSCHCD